MVETVAFVLTIALEAAVLQLLRVSVFVTLGQISA